jgi:hypothetical protein
MSRLGLSQIAFASALMIGFAGAVKADETYNILPQGGAVTTALGNNASAVTYWVDEADGIHVVTTINIAGGSETAFDAQQPALVRFSALILPGQSQVIAIPGPAGSQRQALRIRRLSNRSGGFRIEVDRIADPRPTVY